MLLKVINYTTDGDTEKIDFRKYQPIRFRTFSKRRIFEAFSLGDGTFCYLDLTLVLYSYRSVVIISSLKEGVYPAMLQQVIVKHALHLHVFDRNQLTKIRAYPFCSA